MSAPTDEDVRNMHRAIRLAEEHPRLPFGALLVSPGGEVLSEGINRSAESPIWHGEMVTIHGAATNGREFDWSSLTLYTTAEPCPMCQSAVIWAGIRRVVYGTSIEFLQQLGWKQIDLRAEDIAARADFTTCQIIGGILEAECNALFRQALVPNT